MQYKLGDTVYWVYSSTHYQKQVPCPMCFGKCVVTIILGDDSQTKIECGFCQRGIARPNGLATAWEPHAEVKSGVITGISSRDGIRYEVGRELLYQHELYSDEKTAQLVRDAKFEEVKEIAEKWFLESFITAKKKQIWSAGYHRECIKREERSIEWHQLRLGMIKEKKNGNM